MTTISEHTYVKIHLQETHKVKDGTKITEEMLIHAWTNFEQYHKAIIKETLAGLGFNEDQIWNIIAIEMENIVPFSFLNYTYAKWDTLRGEPIIWVIIPISDVRQMQKYYRFLSELDYFLTGYFGHRCFTRFEKRPATYKEREQTNSLLHITS